MSHQPIEDYPAGDFPVFLLDAFGNARACKAFAGLDRRFAR